MVKKNEQNRNEKKQNSPHPKRQSGPGLFPENLILLQQSIGNQAVGQMMSNVIQRTIDKDHRTMLNDLGSLNEALSRLTPPVDPITLGDFAHVRGITPHMLDSAIERDKNTLYDSIDKADVIGFYAVALENLVNTLPPAFEYDTHGDKHFGGKIGTNFTAGKGVVNHAIEELIAPLIGRIRRDANGHNQTYYLTAPAIAHCPKGYNLTVQIDYVYAGDRVCYHGYPDDNMRKFVLSRSKGGEAI